MDTALENGDFKLNSRGYPVKIEAYEEILQRIVIRLICRKGSFVYDRNLGSELHKLKRSQIASGMLEKQALEYAKQALSSMNGVEVVSVKVSSDSDGEQVILNFKISLNGAVKDIDVKI